MTTSRQGFVKAVQQTAGHGGETVDGRPLRLLARAMNDDKWASWTPSEALASKHPMGRGVIAAAAEAMKKR